MPTKIRLQRKGKKGQPFYHIVVADSRAPRDGKCIEKIGVYNTMTNPATIDINFEKAVEWVLKGATPTDTCNAILSDKGVMHKTHLLRGVKKGALTQEQADNKFQQWLTEKESKIQLKIKQNASRTQSEIKKRAEAEAKVKEAKEKEIALKRSKLAKELEEAEAPQPIAETAVEAEAPALSEEPKAEAPAADTKATQPEA